MNVWQQLKQSGRPLVGLSPMDGLTDAAFRYVIAKHAKPDLIFTEFVNIDGIYFSKEEVFEPFLYHKIEKPIIAQVFGIDPRLFYLAAQVVAELGFDGLDINMGCPSKNVSSRGAGAGLIRTPELAAKIVAAAKQGISDWVRGGISPDISVRARRKLETTKARLLEMGTTLPDFSDVTLRQEIPVSIKTRIGSNSNEVETWIPWLIKTGPANISLHGRTFKQLYSGLADWEAIKRAAQIVEEYNKGKAPGEQITFWGNGDVTNREQAQEYSEKYAVDGVLIGRAVLGDPWAFLPKAERPQSYADKLPLILEHSKMHDNLFPGRFFSMRKHLAWYFKGFPGASELRQRLVQASSSKEVEEIISSVQLLTT